MCHGGDRDDLIDLMRSPGPRAWRSPGAEVAAGNEVQYDGGDTMKKVITLALAVLFAASVGGAAFAQSPPTSSNPPNTANPGGGGGGGQKGGPGQEGNSGP